MQASFNGSGPFRLRYRGSDVPLAIPNDPSPLASPENCERVLNDLLETAPSEFGRQDMGLLNLLCAPSLPGSEKLDILRCMARLDNLTGYVKAGLERNLHRFPNDPDFGHSEPLWRVAMMVTLVKLNYGAAYSPSAAADLAAGIDDSPFTDSKEVFIHGLLDDDPKRRWGTCASIPVLIAAIARRLGYPVGLAVTRTHVYCRWENGCCFNIEASNPAGMTSKPDEHYRDELRGGLTSEERRSGYFCRTLHPAEEFALFLKNRVACLLDAARYEETMLWSARALQYAPDDPNFRKTAFYGLDLAMKTRLKRIHPEQKIPAPDQPFFFNVGDLLRVQERCLHLTITAHYREQLGELDEARQLFEDACRQNVYGHNEQRDLQRFLRKHKMPGRTGPLMPPKNLGQPRRFKLMCQQHEEADLLRRMIMQFERKGEMLKARNAMLDLYTFDPGDAELYQRLRATERHPRFQVELKEDYKRRGQAIQPAVALK